MCDEKPPYEIASQPYIDETSSAIAVWAASICSVLGVVGNLLTAIVLTGHPGLRKHSTAPFLTSLAFSDFIFSALNLPLLAARFAHRDFLEVFGYNMCVLFPFFFYSNGIISTFSMACIAVNRFVGIYFSRKMSHWFSAAKSWAMVAGVWLLAYALLALPASGAWGQMGYEPKTFSCTIVEKDNKSPEVFLIVVGIVIPFVIMAGSYSLIFYKVRSTGQQIRKAMESADASATDSTSVALTGERNVKLHTQRRERALTRTLVLTCFAYFVCFLPAGLVEIFNPMPPCYNLPGLHVASSILFWCSAFVNPLIYTCTNKHYREANFYYLRRIFLCRFAVPVTREGVWDTSRASNATSRGVSTRLRSSSRISTPKSSRQSTPRPWKRVQKSDDELNKAEVISFSPEGR